MSTEQEKVKELFEPIDFIHNGMTYRYDRRLIEVEMAEVACEILDFKRLQRERQPDSFHLVMRSQGAEWRILIASYLLRKVRENGEVEEFSLGTVSKTEAFVRKLNVMTDRPRLMECIDDFFTCIGKSHDYSSLLSTNRKIDAMGLLSTVMTARMKEMQKDSATQ